jgi:hypothetical protein
MVAGGKSREEIRFLALLAKTNERAANLGVTAINEGDKDSEGDDEIDWRLPKAGPMSFIFYLNKVIKAAFLVYRNPRALAGRAEKPSSVRNNLEFTSEATWDMFC